MALQEFKYNRVLTIACALLIAVDLFYIPLSLLSIPRYLERVSNLTIPEFGTGIGDVLTNESAAALAAERGMSPEEFAIYSLAVRLFGAGVFTGVCAHAFRNPADRSAGAGGTGPGRSVRVPDSDFRIPDPDYLHHCARKPGLPLLPGIHCGRTSADALVHPGDPGPGRPSEPSRASRLI